MQPTIAANTLFYGDNLPILREHIPDESVDLVYLDPPFNSNRNYSVLFRDESGKHSEAQIEAFEDTWHWSEQAEETLWNLQDEGTYEVSKAVSALVELIGKNQVMAYLVMMAARLVELHRVLKNTGTLYLHCDPTASHYLKVLLDTIFGPTSFMNEVSWKRSSAHSDTKQGMRRYGRIRDVLLVYTKSPVQSGMRTWNAQYTPYTEEYLEAEYKHVSPDGRRYAEGNPTAAKSGGDTEYEWHVKRKIPEPGDPPNRWEADLSEEYRTPRPGYEYESIPPYNGCYWAYSKANMIAFAKSGHLIHRKTGMPRIVQYADEMPGIPLQDSWDDIPPASGNEDLGYPTQKPLKLLERIVTASSNPGDVVLDPFCGCGTAIAAAQKLERRWIGIDITHLSVALMKYRLEDMFPGVQIQVRGEPEELAGARQLALDDRYQFQWWALSLIRAKPLGANKAGGKTGKKGADRGIDGIINFFDGSNIPKRVIVQVKSGKVSSRDIRDLVGTLDREKAAIGVFLTLEDPSGPMKKEAVSAGYYRSQGWGRDYPRMQILTIEQLLRGAQVEMPPQHRTFREAQKATTPEPDHPRLDL